MSRVHWPPELTDFFITALVDECRAGNRPHKTLNRVGKDNVVRRMRDRTGSDWTWDTCKHKWDDLKKKWSCWKRLNQFSGLAFHPRTGVIQMSEQWWDARIRENPVAKVFRRTVLEREEDLDYIFENMEPINISPNEDGGHKDGRAGVPTHYVDNGNSNDSEAHVPMQQITPPPSLPRRTTSMTSASSRKRKSTDPMSSSAPFWEGFRNVCEEISSSMKQNHTCSASKKAEEDAEYEAFMRELLDAGVNPVSQEYIMATEVLVDVTRRGAYRPLPSIDAKLAWIKSIYLITKGQPPSV